MSQPIKGQFRVVEVLQLLGDDKEQEFLLEVVRFPHPPQYAAMARWFEQQGHTVSLDACRNWYRKTYPTGDEARRVNALLVQYCGLDAGVGLGGSLGLLGVAVQSMGKLLDNAGDIQITTTQQYLTALNVHANLLSKMAAIAETIQQDRLIRTRREITLAAAERVAAIVLETLKDTPVESAARLALEGAIARIEEELTRG